MPKKPVISLPQNMIKLSLGIFFVLIGLFGILTNVEESVFSLNNRNLSLEIIFGIIEFVCGAFIIVSMFTVFTRKVKFTVSVIILILWLIRIVASKFFFGIVINKSGIFFRPTFSDWLIVLSCELIIAACLWLNMKTYQD